MIMTHPCPSACRLLRPFLNFIMEKLAVLEEFLVKVETLKKVKFHIYIFQVGTYIRPTVYGAYSHGIMHPKKHDRWSTL